MNYLIFYESGSDTKLQSYSGLVNSLKLIDNRLYFHSKNLDRILVYDQFKMYVQTHYNYTKDEFIVKLKQDIQYRQEFEDLINK